MRHLCISLNKELVFFGEVAPVHESSEVSVDRSECILFTDNERILENIGNMDWLPKLEASRRGNMPHHQSSEALQPSQPSQVFVNQPNLTSRSELNAKKWIDMISPMSSVAFQNTLYTNGFQGAGLYLSARHSV